MTKLIFAGAAALFVTVAAIGQAPPAAAPSSAAWHGKNLKVLPADMPREQVIGVMRGFTASLGVKCTFCHVGVEGQRETMDFPSDANPHKNIARQMMAMTRRINDQDLAAMNLKQAKVTCFTCHRGAEQPLLVPPSQAVPPPVAPPAG